MALAPRPCKWIVNEDGENDTKYCGKDAQDYLRGEVEIAGTVVPVKIPVCPEHRNKVLDIKGQVSVNVKKPVVTSGK